MAEAAEVSARYFDSLARGDVDTAVQLVADDGDFRSPMGQMKDKEQIRAFLGGFETAFPGAQYEIAQVIESGTSVAIEGTYRATHSGPLMMPDGAALPATGRSVSAPFVTIFEVVNGSITSHRPYWDLAGFMGQLTG